MSGQIRVDQITDELGTGSPSFPNGLGTDEITDAAGTGAPDFPNGATGVAESFSTTIGGSGGSSDWTGSDPYTAVMTVSGILSTDVPVADINLSSVTFADVPDVQADWALVYRVAATADNQLTFYATEEPTEDLTVQIQVVR